MLVGTKSYTNSGSIYKETADKIDRYITGFNKDYVESVTDTTNDKDKYRSYILLKPGIMVKEGTKVKTEEETLFVLPSYPDDISDNVDAQWTTVPVLGRPVPVATFTGTGYRTVSFSFDIHREMLGNSNIKDVEDFLFGIKQAVYPSDINLEDGKNDDVNYIGHVPRVATVKLGAFCVKGYITSVNHTWKKPLLYNEDLQCYQYQLCTVGLSINGIDMSENSK